MKSKFDLIVALASAMIAGTAVGAVTADEAKQLDSATLTAWGAERLGNKEGTIPDWSSGKIAAPPEFNPNEPIYSPSPWKDKPILVITSQNVDKYADKLTEGQLSLFKKYPNFRMDIYPSRRTADYPKYVIDNTIKNATSCKGIKQELVLEGCYGGFPFPIPKTGNQIIWNHLVRYTAYAEYAVNTAYVVDATGKATDQGGSLSHNMWPFYDPNKKGPAGPKDLYWKLRFDTISPARKAGEKTMILDPLDSITIGRRAYQYIPGQRRVKLAPDLAYDTPNPVSGGTGTMDQAQIFLGAQDRYDFKLVGKREKYIPYNNYEIFDYKTCPDPKVLTKNFMNPDCMRWELHRVWVVEATLKPGYRHIMPRRVMYFDEDTYAAGLSDDYDAAAKLYRITVQPYHRMYNNPSGYGNFSDCSVFYDLQTGVWSTTCIQGKKGFGAIEETPPADTFFSPEAMAAEGIR